MSQKIVGFGALLLSAVLGAGAAVAAPSYADNGQYENSSMLAPAGQYANMPGQPGAAPFYLSHPNGAGAAPVFASNGVQAQSLGAPISAASPGTDAGPAPVVIEAPTTVAGAAPVTSEPVAVAAETTPAMVAAVDTTATAAPVATETTTTTTTAAPQPEQAVSYHPPKQPEPPAPPYMPLDTRRGIDIGGQVADYRYRAPEANEKISGVTYGGTLSGTTIINDHLFASFEGRYSEGWLDYTGTGDAHNKPNSLWEARGILGNDFLFQYFSLTPYAGFGYRYFDSDLRGTSSTGTALYESENGLLYVPVGIRPRFRIDADSRISAQAEYDFLLQGQETSHLNDTGNGNPLVRNEQYKGYGFRGELMYDVHRWSFGPFFDYWNIPSTKDSVYHSPAGTCGSTTCSLTEPANYTLEIGAQARYHFF
jgi:hypothetical protein